MTLFKAATATNIPVSTALSPPTDTSLMMALNKRERKCLASFKIQLASLTGHSQSVRLLNKVFQHINVGSDPDVTVTVNMPASPPSLGVVNEAGLLFTMYCIREKIKGYELYGDPGIDDGSDPDEIDLDIRPKIVNTLVDELKKAGYVYKVATKNQFYDLINPDRSLIDPVSIQTRLYLMNKYNSAGNPEIAFSNILEKLQKEIDIVTKKFYTGFFGDSTLVMKEAKLVSSGDGSATRGLMGIYYINNVAASYGQIFFGYKFKGKGLATTIEETTKTQFESVGVNKVTTVHLVIDGLDYPESATLNSDPGYETLNILVEADKKKREYNTTVFITLNGHKIQFRANRLVPILRPINDGQCYVTPTPGPTVKTYSFISRNTGLLIATYNAESGDLTFVDLFGGKIDIEMKSGKRSADSYDEVILYLSVIQAGGSVNRGLVGLFNPDKFELDHTQKAQLKTELLNPLVSTSPSVTFGAKLIETVRNFSNAAAEIAVNTISVNALLSQGFIGKVVGGSALTVNSNDRYYLDKQRSSRRLEIESIPDSNEEAKNYAKKCRASMVNAAIIDNNVNMSIISFEDNTWSRLDNKVVNVIPRITEPRFAIISDLERLHKLKTLDSKTEYARQNRPVSSTATVGILSTYTDVDSQQHPDPTIAGGTGIATDALQLDGFIPCYNPVLGGLRCFGVLEAIRDNLSKDSTFDYYVFRTFHELIFKSIVSESLLVPLDVNGIHALGLAGTLNYFEYQTLKWYDTTRPIHDIDNYHAGTNSFKILVPPGSGQNSPNGGAYPALTHGTAVDVYACVVANGTNDGFVHSAYCNDPVTEKITITLTDPHNNSSIHFYDEMENVTKSANGKTGTIEYRIYSMEDYAGITSTSYVRDNLASAKLVVGVGGVAKFAVNKATAGTVDITISQVGAGAITTETVTITFV